MEKVISVRLSQDLLEKTEAVSAKLKRSRNWIVREVLENSDCPVLPSLYEGYGRVAVEAMAFGVSVIMSDVGLAGEVLVDHQNSLIAQVNNLDALVVSMKEMIKNKDLREKLKQNALETVKSLPSQEQTFKKLFSYL